MCLCIGAFMSSFPACGVVENAPDDEKPSVGMSTSISSLESALNSEMQALVLKSARTSSIEDIQMRILIRVLSWAGMSLQEEMLELVSRSIPVCDWAQSHLCKLDGSFLAGVPMYNTEKMQRLMTNLHKKHSEEVNVLLAVDGLAFTSTAPNFEVKRYVDHLRFGQDHETMDWFSKNESDVSVHVAAVRQMYGDCASQIPNCRYYVYTALKEAYGEFVKLAELKDVNVDLDANVVERLKQGYVKSVGKSRMSRLYERFPKLKQKEAADKMEE